MIGICQLLLFIALLLTAAQGELLNADNTQACIDLCASCGGTATFVDDHCECHIPEDKQGSECINRIKQQAEILGMSFVTHDLTTAERLARCSSLGSRRISSGSPLVSSSNTGCVKCCSDQMTGASNPSNTPPAPEQPPPVANKIQQPPTAKNPSVGSPKSSCGSSSYQPVVTSPWVYNNAPRLNPSVGVPYYGAHLPFLGAHQPYLGAYYPHSLSAFNPSLGQAPSPMLSAIATGTHRVLQGLSNMVAPYATDAGRSNVVGASEPRGTDTNCLSSQQPATNYPASPSILRSEPSPINPTALQQLLAHQNSILEALSHELANYAPQPGAHPVQYAPPQYALASPKSTGHCVCPDDSESVGDPHSHPPSSEASSKKTRDQETVTASNPNSIRKSSKSDETEETKNIKKMTEETESAAEKAAKKEKRETRQRSSGTNRKKRGDAKYIKNKDA